MTDLYCNGGVFGGKCKAGCRLTQEKLDEKGLLDASNNCTNPNCGHHYGDHPPAPQQAASGEIELDKKSLLCNFNCGTLSELWCARV